MMVGVCMGYSQDDFDRDATALLKAFAISTREEEIVKTSSFALSDWILNNGDSNEFHSDSYLSHPPVTVSSVFASLNEVEDDNPSSLNQDEVGDISEEEGIFEDDQCYVNDKNDDNLQDKLVTQWTFSIVYSSTYQAPILYFHVQEDATGNPVGRQILLKILENLHQRMAYHASSDFPTESWEFVSQEEHPITAIPSFFLHPCQSAQRLQLLTSKDKHVGSEETSCVDSDDEPEASVLWAWMSMILPAVGHSVPSAYFSHIQNCVQKH